MHKTQFVALIKRRPGKYIECADQIKFQCPNTGRHAHGDADPSAWAYFHPDGGIILRCACGASHSELADALGVKRSELASPTASKPKSRGGRTLLGYERKGAGGVCVAVHPYVVGGKVLYAKLRYKGGGKSAWIRPKPGRQLDPASVESWTWDDVDSGQYPKDIEASGKYPALYNEDEISKIIGKDSKRVIFAVEGEKCVDVARRIGMVAVSTPNGAKGDWKRYPATKRMMQCRQIVTLPDNDAPGNKHMTALEELAGPKAIRVELPGLHEADDIADWYERLPDKSMATQLILYYVRDALRVRDEQREAEQKPEAGKKGVTQEDIDGMNASSPYFTALGYDDRHYYFLEKRTRQVRAYSASALGQSATLMELAPSKFWHERYSSENGRIVWNQCTNFCLQIAKAAGPFSMDRLRGRGCWRDGERIVFHMGDRILVDDKPSDLLDVPSRYVYEWRQPIRLPEVDRLTDADAAAFVALAKKPRWRDPNLTPILFVGWLAAAPIAGALSWRPHIWITGPAGSGKSWVLSNIARPVLGTFAVDAQGETTPAGLRQYLKTDARPVVFDEAEAETESSRRNLQGLLALVRISSSEDGGEVIKGSASGEAEGYVVRSMFAFASIGGGAVNRADTSRITALRLRATREGVSSVEDGAIFEAMRSTAARMLTPEFAAAWILRSVSRANVIRQNAITFAAAIQSRVNDQRIGDQYGAMIAGYWSLMNGQVFTVGEARDIIDDYDLHVSDAAAEIQEAGEQWMALSHLLASEVRAIRADNIQTTATMGTLVEVVLNIAGDEGCSVDVREAIDVLARHGVRVETDISNPGLWIANSGGIDKLYSRTPYEKLHRNFLREIPGAMPSPKGIRFAGFLTRATWVPISALDGPSAPSGPTTPANTGNAEGDPVASLSAPETNIEESHDDEEDLF